MPNTLRESRGQTFPIDIGLIIQSVNDSSLVRSVHTNSDVMFSSGRPHLATTIAKEMPSAECRVSEYWKNHGVEAAKNISKGSVILVFYENRVILACETKIANL